MFRLYSDASRSARHRSSSTLRFLRSFRSTTFLTSQTASSTQKAPPAAVPTREKVASKNSALSEADNSPVYSRTTGHPERGTKRNTGKARKAKPREAVPKIAKGLKASTKAAASKKAGRPRILKPTQSVLVEYLYNGLGGSKKRVPKGDPKRINVVSENLCGRNKIPLPTYICRAEDIQMISWNA